MSLREILSLFSSLTSFSPLLSPSRITCTPPALFSIAVTLSNFPSSDLGRLCSAANTATLDDFQMFMPRRELTTMVATSRMAARIVTMTKGTSHGQWTRT